MPHRQSITAAHYPQPQPVPAQTQWNGGTADSRGCETKIFRVQRHSEWNREREFSPFAARCRRARAGRFRAAANPCAAAQPLGEPGNFAVSVRVQNFQRSYLLRPTPTLVKKFSTVLPTATYCDFGPPLLPPAPCNGATSRRDELARQAGKPC